MAQAHVRFYDPVESVPAPAEDGREKAWQKIEEDDDNMFVVLERPRLRREFEAYLQARTSEI
jgi:hypothetical protein